MPAVEVGVHALLTGTSQRDKAAFVLGLRSETITLPYIMFLIRTPEAAILVDTGVCSPEQAPRWRFEQTEAQRPMNVLAGFGLTPDDVEIVIQTHLHWDHCANNRLFPRARFFVQREELRYAAAPLPIHAVGYGVLASGATGYAGTKFEVLEGDAEIVPGVSVLLTPGHTPGLQSVLVALDGRSCLLASDNVCFYESLPGNDWQRFKPGATFVDLEDYYRSIRRICSLHVRIVPGHDAAAVAAGNLLGDPPAR